MKKGRVLHLCKELTLSRNVRNQYAPFQDVFSVERLDFDKKKDSRQEISCRLSFQKAIFSCKRATRVRTEKDGNERCAPIEERGKRSHNRTGERGKTPQRRHARTEKDGNERPAPIEERGKIIHNRTGERETITQRRRVRTEKGRERTARPDRREGKAKS